MARAIAILILIAASLSGCSSSLVTASMDGDLNTVKTLIADDRHRFSREELCEAAQKAAIYGRLEIVKYLLKEGKQDVNCIDEYGWTPLMCASYNGQMETVKYLVDNGADVNAKGMRSHVSLRGFTALTLAAQSGHTGVARYLIDRGADVEGGIAYLEGLVRMDYNTRQTGAGVALLGSLRKPSAPAPVLGTPDPSRKSIVAKTPEADRQPSRILPPDKKAYAIVIGIEKYRQRLPAADFAGNDAKAVSEYLSKVMGYPEENVITLYNENASHIDLVKYIERWLPNNFETGGRLFVYYSGHGANNPKTGDAYLVPYDGDPAFIADTGYPLQRLYSALGKLPAREIVVALDSCFSGAGGRSVLPEGARPLVMNMKQIRVTHPKMTILTAADGNQISSTYREKGHGLFTYFLLKGLRDKDVLKQDGSLSAVDLYEYLKPQIERIARRQYNNEQTPQLIRSK